MTQISLLSLLRTFQPYTASVPVLMIREEKKRKKLELNLEETKRLGIVLGGIFGGSLLVGLFLKLLQIWEKKKLEKAEDTEARIGDVEMDVR
ncbi:hypothetical protein EX30DRAFT_337020 [Ascodesmis nigricans]|uniref:Uncharacterized protein n=1 Tax=Ascodesmis nigricans TaxID=341454 RepID=A0A4S2N5Y9_9PEZI|nr:hypothetical protein EX30DRAFT_337020 [Ascodesmis nigricans]